MSKVITQQLNQAEVKAVSWFMSLLKDVETYDQAPLQHVLNDHGVFKDMANVLIDYWESVRK